MSLPSTSGDMSQVHNVQATSSRPAHSPPFTGFIETTYDALLVFEAGRRGLIPRVTRRLTEEERSMVKSGAVFIFDESESGIKRWTDGLIWSPSRILGNFLVSHFSDNPGWGNADSCRSTARPTSAMAEARTRHLPLCPLPFRPTSRCRDPISHPSVPARCNGHGARAREATWTGTGRGSWLAA